MLFRKKKFFLRTGKNSKVVFLLTGWRSKMWEYYFVVIMLLIHGFDCIVYDYDKDILSPDTKKTVLSFNTIVKDILKNMEEYKSIKTTEFYLFGTSLGSALSIMVANRSRDIKKVILNLTGADLATTVWSWDSIEKEFKESLIKKQISPKALSELWKDISPINNLSNVSKKKILIYIARNDEVIPFTQSKELIEAFDKKNIDYELVINKNTNHVFSGFINLLNFQKYITFLNTQL